MLINRLQVSSQVGRQIGTSPLENRQILRKYLNHTAQTFPQEKSKLRLAQKSINESVHKLFHNHRKLETSHMSLTL